MELKLKLFLILICIIFDIYVYNKVSKGKLQLKYSFVWYLISLLLIFVTIFTGILEPIRNLLGFETVSNMIFLFGFFLLAMVIFTLSVKVSEQSSKITVLTQEVALLKKERSNEKIHK